MDVQALRDNIPFITPSKERQRVNELLDQIPGSLSHLELVNMIKNPIKYLHDRAEQHGRVFKTRLMFPAIWVLGAEEMKKVFVSERDAFSYEEGYGKLSFARIFEDSIITQDGTPAMQARNVIMPAVGRLGIRESAERVQKIWRDGTTDLDDGISRNAYDFVHSITFRVSANALTGLDLGSELDEMFPKFRKMLDGTMQSAPIAFPFSPLAEGIKMRHELEEFFRPRIVKMREDGHDEGMVGLLANYRDEDGNYLPVDTVVNHLLLLFWAGYDTTASAGSWCMHLLAHHPEWQDRLRDEANEVLGDGDFDMAAVSKLTQLGWFLREQERHCPSIIMFTRGITREVEVGGYVLPKGVSLMYSPYMTHHLPDAFERPNVFDPGRWNPELGDKVAKASNLIGFGGGPRLCPGRNFALMQLRVMIATVLRDYQLEPDPGYTYHRQGLPTHHPVNSRIFFRRIQK